jgi:hypothetical protein
MEKKGLLSILNELLEPIGFKRKGNYWVINGTTITKMINLQKSNYSNAYYINYGYILNSVPLENLMMHVYQRVTSSNVEERERINFLLDLEQDITDDERSYALNDILQRQLVVLIQSINSEEDLIKDLVKWPHLNSIPLAVKKHLKLIPS